ncbi:hypothetical protein FK268_22490 [Tsukamurella sputi]|uniref:Uncharacterized protein n=1 Tax=Tsukamurella sputi TaxID=2591848 RepID=A0A5C5RGQ4_9ACTN|nr:hypothetical protein [Tsukamurella sputi]TWS21812.1 hypothetical protein FK268_22490 [Tsukamurella sputi]
MSTFMPIFRSAPEPAKLTRHQVAVTVEQSDDFMRKLARILGAQQYVPAADFVFTTVFDRVEAAEVDRG